MMAATAADKGITDEEANRIIKQSIKDLRLYAGYSVYLNAGKLTALQVEEMNEANQRLINSPSPLLAQACIKLYTSGLQPINPIEQQVNQAREAANLARS